MKSTTNGVAMPSLSPLSTLRMRRIRIGTAGLVTTGSPRAASVGARIAPMSSAVASGSSGKTSHADEPARGDRQQQPDPEEATDQAGVAAESGAGRPSRRP